ncbi:XkdX family protein [Staphylococcus epidermidis]|nr:XkdX family protein [Staphylococcus epidermidis]
MFPPYSTIEFLYNGGYYTNDDIYTFVQLDCLTKKQYTELTGEKYPYKEDEWELPQA